MINVSNLDMLFFVVFPESDLLLLSCWWRCFFSKQSFISAFFSKEIWKKEFLCSKFNKNSVESKFLCHCKVSIQYIYKERDEKF